MCGLALLAVRYFPAPRFAVETPRSGTLTINSVPAAAEVVIDGEVRGVSPLTLPLMPGAHTVIVRSGNDERVLPLTITAGAEVTHYLEMKAAPESRLGGVSVSTDPPGARVTIDGRPRGMSPITVPDLTAEEHTITIESATGSAERKVMVPAGGTAAVVFSRPNAAGPVGGWLSISSPFAVDVLENSDVVGTSGSSRIMLAAGRHRIMLSNSALGFAETRVVEVVPGRMTSIRVDPPKVSISVNARPWAEVVVDGKDAGQTPIANLAVSIGSHEIVFTHPQLGQRKQTVTVTAKGPNRVAVDLTQ